MATIPNSTDNVSTGKGVAGGYLFSAPKPGTTEALDTLITGLLAMGELSDSFSNLGFVANDGLTESESKSTSTETDMNGDPIYTTSSDRNETWKVRLVEMKREAALKEIYGDGNVSGTTTLVAQHNGDDHPEHVYVLELVLKDGSRARKVMPLGQVTEIGDMVINSTTLLGREITISGNMYTNAAGTVKGTAFDVYGPKTKG